jgi:flagellar biosynthetic protein FliP
VDSLVLPKITLGLQTGASAGDASAVVQIILVLTVLTLAPAILIMMTSFTRTVVVLSFVRSALATQQMPPNQVLIGLALFLTAFVMSPIVSDINAQAYQPFVKGECTQEQAIERATVPLRQFMLKQIRAKDLALFTELAGLEPSVDPSTLPLSLVIPAFTISELKTAFQMGFVIFMPFLVIDMVVAGTLMSMGMLMLPPMMISLPFKIVLFVLADGWYLVVKSLVTSFR